MDKTVILVSGGINSTVAAALAREQGEPVLLHIAWGHRTAEREKTAFEQITTHLKVDKAIAADLGCLAAFGGNARVSKRIAIEDATALRDEVPTTFMLGLMPTLLSVAATWAGSMGARRVIVGISEDHGVPGPAIAQLYPDYKREFLQTFNLMLEYAKPARRELLVEAPLIDMTRSEVIALGHRLKVPFEKTWSCYRNIDEPCGKCLGCATRAAGFIRAGYPDPLLLIEPAGKAS